MSPRRRRSRGRLISEVTLFAVIGALNTAFDIAVFNILLFGVFEHAPLAAKAVSTTISATTSYFMNRQWTWRHRARTGTRRELPLFLLISGLALGITEGSLLVSHYGFGLTSKLADNVAANVIGLLLSAAFRFLAFKRFVFLHQDRDERSSQMPLRFEVRDGKPVQVGESHISEARSA